MTYAQTGLFTHFGDFCRCHMGKVGMDAQKSPPKARTIPIRGDKVAALRIKKGWSVADLARKAICSAKTINSVEQSKEVFESTLIKIAKALGVEDVLELRANPTEVKEATAVPSASPNTPQSGGTFVILSDPGDYDETTDPIIFIQKLKLMYSLKGDIIILDVRKGSIAIDFMLADAEDARIVAYWFCANGPRYEPDRLLLRTNIDITEEVADAICLSANQEGRKLEEILELIRGLEVGDRLDFRYHKPHLITSSEYHLFIERTKDGFLFETLRDMPSPAESFPGTPKVGTKSPTGVVN